MQPLNLVSSANIEIETGLNSELLRKWRQRYGFPLLETSEREKSGYSRNTINRLLLIKRLLQGGFTPIQIIGKTEKELDHLQMAALTRTGVSKLSGPIHALVERLKQCDLVGLQMLLVRERANGTLTEFVCNTVAPLLVAVGQAWSRNEIEIYHEHLCTSIIERYLQTEILTSKHKPTHPTVIFATAPDEHHRLGLLMCEAVLAGQGAKTINLGSNVPLNDMKMAAIACRANVIALSFSFAYSTRRVRPVLTHLRHILPPDIEIWAGGKGADSIRRPKSGVQIFLNLVDAVAVLNEFGKHNPK